LLDGIRWRERVGAPWRDVPERYGHWQSIYALFRSWQRQGVWRRVWITLLGFADTAGLICWQLSVNSTINRAHQHAAGARQHPKPRRSHLETNRPITGSGVLAAA
jgi:transposase